MALDIYSDDDAMKVRFQIAQRDLPLFEAAFDLLRRKTGNFVDPYGKSRIYPDHQRILIEALSKIKQPKIVEFRDLLRQTEQRQIVLFVDGD